jgi:GrpB-like predicted nucleotidyltransferase (UPF0157 family)
MATPITVTLVDYNPDWPDVAAFHMARLAPIGSLLLATHHIGSTSVPGLAAKPVIDLMPIVSDLAAFDTLRPTVEALGFGWHGEFGVEGRRFCTFDDPETGTRLVHLHCYQTGSLHARRQLAFRDYIRAFPDIAKAYELEKRRARDIFPDNSVEYSREKGAFIRSVEGKAASWFVEEANII